MAGLALEIATSLSLSDPPGSNVLVAALDWMQSLILGTVATVIATIAIATAGLLMLSGRLQIRRGVTVILGCFIIFSAPGIAEGVRSGLNPEPASYVASELPIALPVSHPTPSLPNAHYDPYAGAAVPAR